MDPQHKIQEWWELHHKLTALKFENCHCYDDHEICRLEQSIEGIQQWLWLIELSFALEKPDGAGTPRSADAVGWDNSGCPDPDFMEDNDGCNNLD